MISYLANRLWYGAAHPLPWIFVPFSLVYRAYMSLRRWFLQHFCQYRCPVPLIVVGNLTAGGVGKTPLVIAIAQALQQKGLRVGIVSRGYGARIKQFPYVIQIEDCATQVGDEPLLLAQKVGCPVVIAPQRTAAVRYLLDHYQSQVIISDDGLQHYRMGRAIEIAVIDGTRGLGNGWCLPAGPLREAKSRLNEVDFIVVNEGSWDRGYAMHLLPGKLTQLQGGNTVDLDSLSGDIAAIAAIGNPQRFYSTLSQLGIQFKPHTYPDHYQFKEHDLDYSAALIIMTEKDAVKCRAFADETMYYLPVTAALNEAFWNALWTHQQLKGLL